MTKWKQNESQNFSILYLRTKDLAMNKDKGLVGFISLVLEIKLPSLTGKIDLTFHKRR